MSQAYESLETEEFISASEYRDRLQRGEIDTRNTRIIPPDFVNNREGGFMVKLPSPRYRAPIFPPIEGGAHGG